jgi:hypothetical protein
VAVTLVSGKLSTKPIAVIINLRYGSQRIPVLGTGWEKVLYSSGADHEGRADTAHATVHAIGSAPAGGDKFSLLFAGK